MNEAVIATVGVLFGGAGLKIIEHYLNRSKQITTDERQWRDEMRGDLSGLKGEVASLRTEVDTWRQKYYDLLNDHLQLKAKCTELEELAHRHKNAEQELSLLRERHTQVLADLTILQAHHEHCDVPLSSTEGPENDA
jgi:chromosome segregation ATPase